MIFQKNTYFKTPIRGAFRHIHYYIAMHYSTFCASALFDGFTDFTRISKSFPSDNFTNEQSGQLYLEIFFYLYCENLVASLFFLHQDTTILQFKFLLFMVPIIIYYIIIQTQIVPFYSPSLFRLTLCKNWNLGKLVHQHRNLETELNIFKLKTKNCNENLHLFKNSCLYWN